MREILPQTTGLKTTGLKRFWKGVPDVLNNLSLCTSEVPSSKIEVRSSNKTKEKAENKKSGEKGGMDMRNFGLARGWRRRRRGGLNIQSFKISRCDGSSCSCVCVCGFVSIVVGWAEVVWGSWRGARVFCALLSLG